MAVLTLPITEAQRLTEANRYFEHCMDVWVRWMRSRAAVGPRGISRFDSVCGEAATNFMAAEGDSELVYEKADAKLAVTVNACVESLMPHERLAVYKHYRLARWWAFKGLDEASALDMGMRALRLLIAKRC